MLREPQPSPASPASPPALIDEEGVDKYALDGLPEIDCESRYPICRAACCTMRFPLSRQDLDEGVVRYDPVMRYLNAADESGYCVHNDSSTCACTVYEHRPAPCRIYDCRNDTRIWVDFEARVPSPRLWTRTWRREAGIGG